MGGEARPTRSWLGVEENYGLQKMKGLLRRIEVEDDSKQNIFRLFTNEVQIKDGELSGTSLDAELPYRYICSRRIYPNIIENAPTCLKMFETF